MVSQRSPHMKHSKSLRLPHPSSLCFAPPSEARQRLASSGSQSQRQGDLSSPATPADENRLASLFGRNISYACWQLFALPLSDDRRSRFRLWPLPEPGECQPISWCRRLAPTSFCIAVFFLKTRLALTFGTLIASSRVVHPVALAFFLSLCESFSHIVASDLCLHATRLFSYDIRASHSVGRLLLSLRFSSRRIRLEDLCACIDRQDKRFRGLEARVASTDASPRDTWVSQDIHRAT